MRLLFIRLLKTDDRVLVIPFLGLLDAALFYVSGNCLLFLHLLFWGFDRTFLLMCLVVDIIIGKVFPFNLFTGVALLLLFDYISRLINPTYRNSQWFALFRLCFGTMVFSIGAKAAGFIPVVRFDIFSLGLYFCLWESARYLLKRLRYAGQVSVL